MPNRLTVAKRRIVFQMLVERDGARCNNPTCPHEMGRFRLEIDHIDHNKDNWEIGNLQILCQSCNVKKEHARREKEIRAEVDGVLSAHGCMYMYEKKGMPGDTVNIRHGLNVPEGGTTFHANAMQEPVFRQTVLEAVMRGELEDPPRHWTRKDLLNHGSEMAQCSPLSAARHLDKLTNPISGLLEVVPDEYQNLVVVLRKRRV